MVESSIKRKKKIRYATKETEAEDTPLARNERLAYDDRNTPWPDSQDNPMSMNFVPLTQRTDREKMRWWALQQRRRRNIQTAGVFDA